MYKQVSKSQLVVQIPVIVNRKADFPWHTLIVVHVNKQQELNWRGKQWYRLWYFTIVASNQNKWLEYLLVLSIWGDCDWAGHEIAYIENSCNVIKALKTKMSGAIIFVYCFISFALYTTGKSFPLILLEAAESISMGKRQEPKAPLPGPPGTCHVNATGKPQQHCRTTLLPQISFRPEAYISNRETDSAPESLPPETKTVYSGMYLEKIS